MQIVVELADDLERAQPPGIGRHPHREAACGAQQREVVVDHAGHARAQHLDRDLGAVVQASEMDLRDRGRGDRLGVELGKYLADGAAQTALDFSDRQRRIEGWDVVLQLRELVGNIGRQQIASRRKHLTKFHEDRAEGFERHAQPSTARCVQTSAQAHDADRPQHPARAVGGLRARGSDLVQAIAPGDEKNLGKAADLQRVARCRGSVLSGVWFSVG